jgi:MFS superfamily sulfate permease-like transporter
MGAANLGSGLASGMVVNGSLSKTAVNGGAGAKSQISGLVVAGLSVLTLLFLTPDPDVVVVRVESGLYFPTPTTSGVGSGRC